LRRGQPGRRVPLEGRLFLGCIQALSSDPAKGPATAARAEISCGAARSPPPSGKLAETTSPIQRKSDPTDTPGLGRAARENGTDASWTGGEKHNPRTTHNPGGAVRVFYVCPFRPKLAYGWTGHKPSSGFSDLAPSILYYN
jgi:hypothetical protein